MNWKNRGLNQNGKKAELINRLEHDDRGEKVKNKNNPTRKRKRNK